MGRWDRTLGVYDRFYRRTLNDAIDGFGKNIEVMYRTSTACGTCTWDPINEETTNPNCSTCDGFGRVYSEETIRIKAAVQKFAGNLRYVREGQSQYQIMPFGEARITMKLCDTLLDINVSTSATIFKDCQKVVVDGDYYKPKDSKRFGVKDLSIIEVTLERVREETL